MQLEITPPFLLFVGDEENPLNAKTAMGVAQWRASDCLGQYRLPGSGVDLGLPEMSPAAAAAAGAKTMLWGVANVGGRLPDDWIESLFEAVEAGLDICAGTHAPLSGIPGLSQAAEAAGIRLVDTRKPPAGLPVGTGRKRSGRRLLTIGTDCVVGKKYSALAIAQEMRARGMNVDFRATGQTGIMIAGGGIPIDAVAADFVSGAAEMLSPDNDDDHWDVIEGQGSLFHPGYAGVTLGLLHGSQPDAFVVCHEAGRDRCESFPDFALPSIAALVELALTTGRLTNPAIRCAGISINTSALGNNDRRALLADLARETGLPCVDPLATGVAPIVDHIVARSNERT